MRRQTIYVILSLYEIRGTSRGGRPECRLVEQSYYHRMSLRHVAVSPITRSTNIPWARNCIPSSEPGQNCVYCSKPGCGVVIFLRASGYYFFLTTTLAWLREKISLARLNIHRGSHERGLLDDRGRGVAPRGRACCGGKACRFSFEQGILRLDRPGSSARISEGNQPTGATRTR